MSLITQRIKHYLEAKKISTNKAEVILGLSRGALSKPFRNNKSITTETLEKILNAQEFEDLNPLYLLGKEKAPISANKIYTQEIQTLQDLAKNYFSFPEHKQTEINALITESLEGLIQKINKLEITGDEHDNLESYEKELRATKEILKRDKKIEVLKKQIEILSASKSK